MKVKIKKKKGGEMSDNKQQRLVKIECEIACLGMSAVQIVGKKVAFASRLPSKKKIIKAF